MKIETTDAAAQPQLIYYKRCTVDLKSGEMIFADVPCRNLEDVLGGFGRSFQDLARRQIDRAYCDENPLIVNTGLLTGSSAMTAMRTYFSGYSPIKGSKKGLPAAMWATGSGKFGAKFKWTGLDELIFENRSDKPLYVVIRESASGPVVELKEATHLLGLSTHEKIMALQKDYPAAHFAAIGQAGEHWQNNYMGAVALSTENQLKSKEDKCRFAGRGGMGSLMGYKTFWLWWRKVATKSARSAMPSRRSISMSSKGVVLPESSRSAEGEGGGHGPHTTCCRLFMLFPLITFVRRGTISPKTVPGKC